MAFFFFFFLYFATIFFVLLLDSQPVFIKHKGVDSNNYPAAGLR